MKLILIRKSIENCGYRLDYKMLMRIFEVFEMFLYKKDLCWKFLEYKMRRFGGYGTKNAQKCVNSLVIVRFADLTM